GHYPMHSTLLSKGRQGQRVHSQRVWLQSRKNDCFRIISLNGYNLRVISLISPPSPCPPRKFLYIGWITSSGLPIVWITEIPINQWTSIMCLSTKERGSHSLKVHCLIFRTINGGSCTSFKPQVIRISSWTSACLDEHETLTLIRDGVPNRHPDR